MRASDADRDRVAERLREATAEGRLRPEELEERLDATFSARTYGQLDTLVADLPARRAVRPWELEWIRPALALAVAILVALAVAATLVLLITGLLAMWGVWLALGWWFVVHRRRAREVRSARSLRASGCWPHGHPSARNGGWI